MNCPHYTSLFSQTKNLDVPSSLQIQKVMGKAKNYNRWIYEMIAPALGARILDVGCSIGNITQAFLNRDLVVGIDCLQEAVSTVQERFREYHNFKAHCLDFPKGDLSILKKYDFDTIVALNVIEHIEDDREALHAMYWLLCPGGHVGIVVPALKWLYGTMDEEDNHYRRYSKIELSQKLQEAGFVIETLHYINILGIFGWFINGRILKRRIIPENQLSVFDRLIPILRRIESSIKLGVGQSLVAIGKKSV